MLTLALERFFSSLSFPFTGQASEGKEFLRASVRPACHAAAAAPRKKEKRPTT